MNVTRLHLCKQDFKFSAAHFLIFDETRAEMLHGHNYQVVVEVKAKGKFDPTKVDSGVVVDFSELKSAIRQQLKAWDEKVLIPSKNPFLKYEEILPFGSRVILEDQANLKVPHLMVTYSDRVYVFPQHEVVLIPGPNTSVENLSLLFAEQLRKKIQGFENSSPFHQIEELFVRIDETLGQGASVTLEV